MSWKGGRQGVLAFPMEPRGDSSGAVAGVPATSVTGLSVRWSAASPCPFVPDPPIGRTEAEAAPGAPTATGSGKPPEDLAAAGADPAGTDAAGVDAGAADAGALDAGADDGAVDTGAD